MKKLAVFFPGIGYHCDKPLLYYSRKAAIASGYDDLHVLRYAFDGGNIRGNEEKMREAFENLYAQTVSQLSEIAWSRYEDILFVSKSIGTVIASAYAAEHSIPCRHILLTPLEQTYRFNPTNAIAFIGTKDPWSDTDSVVRLSHSRNIPIHVYEDANHSLETGDVEKDLGILADVMGKVEGKMR